MLMVAVALALVPVGLALLAGERWAYVVALAALLFLTDASLRSRSWTDKSWDWQVMVKALSWAGCGVVGLTRLPRTFRLLKTPPGWLTLMFLMVLMISTLWSPTPAYTFEATASLLMLFAFGLAAADVLDERGLLLAILLGCGAVTLPSLAIAPFAMGISAPSPGSTGEPGRLRGLTDHPIPLAAISTLFTYAAFALLARSRGFGLRLLLLVLAAAGIVTALLTQSRIPVLGMVAATAGYGAYRKGGGLLMAPVLVLCIGVALAMESVAGFASFLPHDLLELVARSGSSKEILTLSGRLTIWPYAIDRFTEAPLLGHGHASGMAVFKGFAPWKITHAHNAYLQSLVYVGLLGSLPLFAGLLAQLAVFLRRPQAPRDILLLYTLFSGITEQSMLSNLASSSVILWMVTVGLAARAWRPAKAAASAADNPTIATRFVAEGPERQRM